MPSGLTLSNPVTALVNLKLDAVALCEEGANSRAHILLTKRKENASMTFEELMKALNPDQAQVITAHINGIVIGKDKAIGDLNAKINELTTENETLQKAKPQQPQEEDIFKDLSPAAKALVEKLQGQVTELVADREESLAKDRFAKVKALPIEEAELKSVLKSVSPAVFSILEKAATAIEAGLAPQGTAAAGEVAGDSAADHYAKLEKAANKIMEDETSMSFEKAFTVACERDPETYKKYVKGVN